MKPFDFPIFVDENVRDEVIGHLRTIGKDILTVHEAQLAGAGDLELLEYAAQHGRIVLTHDGDFGDLAIRAGTGFIGVIYLRPGHIKPSFTIETINAVTTSPLVVEPPFLLVVDHRSAQIRIRVRRVTP